MRNVIVSHDISHSTFPNYFIIVNLPITGSGFILPFTALIMPIMQSTKHAMLNSGIKTIPMRMMISNDDTVIAATEVINNTVPWLV